MEGIGWEQLGFLLGVVAGWSLVIIATMRAILSRSFKHYDDKLREHFDKDQKLEKDILEMKADLLMNYIRKEDFIRHAVSIRAKLDGLAEQLTDIRRNYGLHKRRKSAARKGALADIDGAGCSAVGGSGGGDYSLGCATGGSECNGAGHPQGA